MPISATELRLRVSCHLPNEGLKESKAFAAIVSYLKDQKELELGVNGFSQTDGIMGQWWSDDLGVWIDDTVSVLTVDYRIKVPEDATLESAVADLKNYAHECYDKYDSHQEEIWVIAHEVERYL